MALLTTARPRSGETALEPEYSIPPHWRLYDQLALALKRREITRLLVLAPPRTGKTTYWSDAFAAWWLGHFPDDRVMLNGYGASFTSRHGRWVRDVIERWGPSVFNVGLARGSSRVDHWDLAGDRRGGMLSAGAGGGQTGHGCTLMLIDDLVKNWREANSPTHREHTWETWCTTLRTRLEPRAVVVACMTPWHYDDWAGRIQREGDQSGEPWTVVRLPMLAEEDDPLGREPDDPLWSERYDLAACRRIRSEVGSLAWNALYQCRPTPLVGGLFQRDWFREWTWEDEARTLVRLGDRVVALADLRRFTALDPAISERRSADETACGAFGATRSGALVWLDLERDRTATGHRAMMRRLGDRHGIRVHFVESHAFQTLIIRQARENKYAEDADGKIQLVEAGLEVRELPVDSDKVTRALPATAGAEAGQIWMPAHATWKADAIEQILEFPRGRNDDVVDVLSYGWIASRDLVTEAVDVGTGGPRRREDSMGLARGWHAGRRRLRG